MNIERLDDLGRGIGYLDGKITFIPWTIPGDVVEVIVTENHKKYNVAKVKQFIKYSEKRIQPPCPYFTKCGDVHYKILHIMILWSIKLKR